MKLIFLDIDGTLTPPGSNTPPESAVQAIRKAQENGNRVFLCTGRNYDMLSPLLHYGFDGMVASSGGYVTVGDELIFDCPMSDEFRDIALDSLHRNGVFCTIEAAGGSWGDDNLADFLKDDSGDPLKKECLLPALVDTLMHTKGLKVEVLSTNAVWFGVTYKEDKEYVASELKKLHDNGSYPSAL